MMEGVRGETVTSADDAGALVSRACEIPDVSYSAFLAAQDDGGCHWAGPAGLEIAGGGAAVQFTAAGPDRLDRVRTAAQSVFANADLETPAAARPRLLGGCAFFDDHEPTGAWAGFPSARFVLPSVQLTRSGGTTWLTVTRSGPDASVDAVERDLGAARREVESLPAMVPSGGPPGVERTRRTTSREEWIAGVERATERIESRDLVKVVLALALEADVEPAVEPAAVLARLRRTYPECYRFLVSGDDGGAFFGAPPERLVKREGRSVSTDALAGSVARGDTPEEDADLAASLLESEKTGHEQSLVVDAIRDQLAGIADVQVGDRRVRKLATIQHLQTPIEARLDGNDHVLDLVEALHPTPAVGGVPPETARSVIRETERFERGWYASPVGWFDANGDGEFAVAIRSAVAADTRVTLFGGNGIVGDSDPEDEWAEVQLKFRPVLDELR